MLEDKLILAADIGDFRYVSEIVLSNQKIDINFINAEGHSALTAAAAAGHIEIIRLLQTKGATVDLETKKGTALKNAIIHDKFKAVVELLQLNASVNHVDALGYTPLMDCLSLSTGKVNEAILKILLGKKANINHTAKNGDTAISLAMKIPDPNIINTILTTIRRRAFIKYYKNVPIMSPEELANWNIKTVVAEISGPTPDDKTFLELLNTVVFKRFEERSNLIQEEEVEAYLTSSHQTGMLPQYQLGVLRISSTRLDKVNEEERLEKEEKITQEEISVRSTNNYLVKVKSSCSRCTIM